MKKITLPTPTKGNNQPYFTALNGYLVPDYFDRVAYCDNSGNEYTSVDAMDGSSYVVTRVYYYKHGVRAMCFFLSSGAVSAQSPRFAGKDGVANSSSGTHISTAPTSLTICHDSILLGALQASNSPFAALLVKHNADTVAIIYRPPYMDSSRMVNATLKTLNLGKGKVNTGSNVGFEVSGKRETSTGDWNMYPSYHTITMRIPTIDSTESVLTNIRYLLAGPGFDMVATETIEIDGVVYDKLGLLLIPRETT